MELAELIDREKIRQLMLAYASAGDRGKLDDLAASFTLDGVLETDLFALTGPQAIKEGLLRQVGLKPLGEGVRPVVHHHVTSPDIQLLGDGKARSRSYFAVMTNIGLDHHGSYVDKLACVGGRWLFTHRIARLDWQSPESIFPSAGLQGPT